MPDIHEQIDALGVARAELVMLLHALADLGVLTDVLHCQTDECVVGDRYTFGPSRSRTGATIDHKQERRNGGNHRPENLRLAHLACNLARNKGMVISQERRDQTSRVHTGRVWSEQQLAGVRAAGAKRRGVPLTDEHKAAVSASLKGRVVSDETRQKISQAHKGKTRVKKAGEHA